MPFSSPCQRIGASGVSNMGGECHTHVKKRNWFSGKILRCHLAAVEVSRGALGSIPRLRIFDLLMEINSIV